jgi:hypothetical protein
MKIATITYDLCEPNFGSLSAEISRLQDVEVSY